jgi:hypothetical protein
MNHTTSAQRRANRRWWAGAILAIGAAGAFASASSASAQAGLAPLAGCPASQISVSYEVGIDAGLGGYAVTGIRVTDFPASCAARRVAVTVHDAAGAVFGTATGALAAGAVLAMPASAHVSAAQAERLTIAPAA